MTLDAALYQGPILITFLYFCLWYYLLLGHQRGTKYRLTKEYAERGEVFDRYLGGDEQMLSADRAVINTQEQMVPFLLTLWLHALFVSPFNATALGAVYVVLRSLYPFLLGKNLSKLNPKRVFFATGPSYLIIIYLGVSTVYAAFGG